MIKDIGRRWRLWLGALVLIPAVLQAQDHNFSYRVEAEKQIYRPHEPIRIALIVTHNMPFEISPVDPHGGFGPGGFPVHNSKDRKSDVYLDIEGPDGERVKDEGRQNFSFDMPETIKKEGTEKVYLDLRKNYVFDNLGIYSIYARVDGQDAGSFTFRVETVDEQYRNQVLSQMKQGPLKSRRQAMRKARYTGDRKLIEGMLELIASGEQKLKVRLAALEELVNDREEYVSKAWDEVRKPYVTKAVREIAEDGKPPEVRGRALEVLGKVMALDKYKELKAFFLRGLKAENEDVRVRAARALGEASTPGGRHWEFTGTQKKLLKAKIVDENTQESVRYHLLWVVPLDAEDMSWIVKIAQNNPSGRVRARALYRLPDCNGWYDEPIEKEEFEAVINIALNDPDGRVRSRAIDCIGKADRKRGYYRMGKVLGKFSKQLKHRNTELLRQEELDRNIQYWQKEVKSDLNRSPDYRKDNIEFLINKAGPQNPSDRGRLVAIRCLISKGKKELLSKAEEAARKLVDNDSSFYEGAEHKTIGGEARRLLERINNLRSGRGQQKENGTVKHPRLVVDLWKNNILLVNKEKMSLNKLSEMLENKGQNAIVEVKVERGVSIKRTQKVLDMVTEANCHRIKFDGHPGPEK